jgi:hypothetical protein
MAIAGFLVASAALHALCFYLFQVVYPPAISLLPPPAQVSVIAPTNEETRAFLNWLNAEDPALASQTQRSPDARAFQLPRLGHIPSYVAVPPQLKSPRPRPAIDSTPLAMPPQPVPMISAAPAAAPLHAPSTLVFSGALSGLAVTHPELKFKAGLDEAPQAARFRIAVDSLGAIRYLFLEQSSGDAAIDEEARAYLGLCRFQAAPSLTNAPGLVWATGTFEFGTDLTMPATPPERAP